MLHTPKEIADFLVKTYGNSPKGIIIDKDEFEKYLSFAKTKNVLHENAELAAKEGIKNTTLLPGRAIVARAEGEMTRLNEFSNNIILLYGMNGST